MGSFLYKIFSFLSNKIFSFFSKKNYGDINKIKSGYVKSKIFSYLYIRKFYKLIKYNKKIQTTQKIGLEDYRVLSNIEIEIIPNTTNLTEITKFMQKNNNNIDFIHIYAKDGGVIKEINADKKDIDLKFQKIIIRVDKRIRTFKDLFFECGWIKKINYFRAYNNNIASMKNLCGWCNNIKEIDLDFSFFKTKNVKDMSYMFSRCQNLEKARLANFENKNLLTIRGMFEECASLRTVEFSNFNTETVYDMSYLFKDCLYLNKLIFTNFRTDNVINMNSMFNSCESLKDIDLSGFNFDNVLDIDLMFTDCSDELKNKISSKGLNIGEEAFY